MMDDNLDDSFDRYTNDNILPKYVKSSKLISLFDKRNEALINANLIIHNKKTYLL